jgi:hypothetical protein
MKKFLTLLFAIISLTGFAQHKAVQSGFRGGTGAVWFTGDMKEVKKNGMSIGGSWGFVVDIFLMEGYWLNTGFNILYLNGKLSAEGDAVLPDSTVVSGNYDIKLRAKYAEIPVVLSMKTKNINGFFRIYGQIGFGFAYLLKSDGSQTFGSDDGSYSFENDLPDGKASLRSTRESLLLGAGMEFPVAGSTYIRTGLRFDNAFIPVFHNDNKGKNQILEVNVAVIF